MLFEELTVTAESVGPISSSPLNSVITPETVTRSPRNGADGQAAQSTPG